LGAVCVSYNIAGIDSGLKLTPKVLVDIYLGKITNWNDKAIAALNSDLTLPDLNITVVRRSDGSGTTNIFTSYLTKVSTAWATQVGWGKSVNFPVGVGGKGNEGVAGVIKQVNGAVGYIELAYAVQNKMSLAKLKNKAGNYVTPSVESTTAAAKGAMGKIPADFKIMITNAAGEGAYPICGFSWVVVRVNQDNAVTGKKLVDLLNWMLDKGNAEAGDLYYAPLPESLVSKVKDAVATIKY
jgi:phosphate transport system substrate-binding protein